MTLCPSFAEFAKTDGRDAVGRVDDGRASRNLGLLLDEDRAARLEIADDVDVVDDLLADVDGRAVVLERELDRLDGALDAGAVAARRGEKNALDHRHSVAGCQRADCATRIPAMTTAPPMSCVGPNVSPSHAHATTVATTGSSVATIDARVAQMCRSDPVSSENVTIVPITTMNATRAQTGAEYSDRFPCSETSSPRTLPREVPQRLDDRPEQRGEEEAVERERGGVAVPALALGHQEVRGERQRAAERGRDADRAEGDARPQLDDEREPGEAQRDRDPDPPSDVLLVDEPREERDEQRRGELDEERDADREVLDRDEVEPLHERDADEAERDEEEELAAADPQPRRRDHEQEREEEDRGARVADLRELERREPRAEDDLRHAPVDGEERRRGGDHDVAEPRLVVRAPLGEQRGGVDHEPAGYPPTLCRFGA